MTLLVMEYCSLGNLHKAITAGRFHDAQRRPNLVRAAGAAPVWRSGLGNGCCCCACMLRRPLSWGHVFLVRPLRPLSPSLALLGPCVAGLGVPDCTGCSAGAGAHAHAAARSAPGRVSLRTGFEASCGLRVVCALLALKTCVWCTGTCNQQGCVRT